MVGIKTLLLDTNVWVSYLLAQEPEAQAAHRLVETAGKYGVTLAYAPSTLKDVFYLIPRTLRRDAIATGTYEEGISFKPAAWGCVNKITEIAVAVPQSLVECELAYSLRSIHNDYEDNLVFATAETCNADYVVTTDEAFLKHYAPACITPEQATHLIEVNHPDGK